MARPAAITENEQQRTEPSIKTTSDPIARRESYVAGEPDSAPELVRFMTCRNVIDLNKINIKNLLTAVT